MSKTFLEMVTRINTSLSDIALTLEWIQDAVACGDLILEEAQKDEGIDRIVLRVSVRPGPRK